MASTQVLSFIGLFLLLAPVVYFPTASLSFSVFFFYPTPTKTAPVTVCVFVSSHWEQHKTSASFENANRFYLWPAPVREWVRAVREVFVCNCVSVRVAASVYAYSVNWLLCICLTQSVFALAVVLGNCTLFFGLFFWCSVSVSTARNACV